MSDGMDTSDGMQSTATDDADSTTTTGDDAGKTVLLGFDALDFRYLDAFDLPNFDALRERGVEAPLHSTHPPWTASAWPSLYTGMDPSHHGVYSFFAYGHEYPDDAAVVTRADVDAPALWNYLSAEGVPSTVLNMPVTHPADDIVGALIPGYLAPENAPGSPPEVRTELASAIGEYRIYSRAELADDKAEKLDGYVELIDLRRRAAEHLLGASDWQLGVIQVQKTDAVFHNFEKPAAFERVYRAADDLLGGVLDTVPEDTNVVVCSDHGMGPVEGYKIYLNEVLREHGFVETTAEGAQSTLVADKAGLVEADDDDGADEHRADTDRDDTRTADLTVSSVATRAAATAESVLSRVGVSPADVYAVATRLGVEEQLLDLVPSEVTSSVGEYVDWGASKAYCRIGSECGVRLNVAGREPAGVVPESEYDAVREDVIAVLSGLETPDGETALELVEPREAIYEGKHADLAPDIVVRPAGMNHTLQAGLPGSAFIPVPATEAHDHKLTGAFVGAGPGFDTTPAPVISDLSITDIAPIAMGLLGRDVPARMTGHVPTDLVSVPTTRREYGDVPFATGTGVASEDAVEDRLEDLGYL